jgi:hypothetical protein
MEVGEAIHRSFGSCFDFSARLPDTRHLDNRINAFIEAALPPARARCSSAITSALLFIERACG